MRSMNSMNKITFQYLGNWYQKEGIPVFYAPSGSKCIRATYGARGKLEMTLIHIFLINYTNLEHFNFQRMEQFLSEM